MAELRIENGPQKGTSVPLPESGKLLVGSQPKAAQLVLVDPQVGSVHFAIGPAKGGGLAIKDLGAPAGTSVNGKRISAVRLRHGDRIQAGGTTLSFLAPEESAADDAANPLVGKTIGGYRIEQYLGKGGMGTVYKAVQISLDRVVALKILAPHLVQDRSFVELFFREARAAGKLNHPNVVQVYDVGQEGDFYFFSMEYMEHGTLEARLRREGKIPLEESVQIALDAAKGLQFAEANRIVHRDIKPDNIMISSHGHAKIADLGLAAGHESGETRQGKVFGTPHFISPEQARGESVDSRSDLYSLGATFFRILTGKTPFSGKDVREILQKQIQEEAPPLREIDPEIAPEIEATVAKLLQKDPAKRHQTAKELAEELEAFQLREFRTGQRAWIFAGTAAVLLLGSLLLWRPWADDKPKIIEKVVEAPVDPEKAAEAERLRQELLEKDARIAYQGSPNAATPEKRAPALELVAKNYPGTEFGNRAAKEAGALRELLAERARAAKEKEEKLAALERSLREKIQPLLDSHRFSEAARVLAASPELRDGSEDENGAKKAEALLDEIRRAESASVRAWIEEGKDHLAGNRLDAAEASLQKVRHALAPTAGVGESLLGAFEKDLAEAEDALRAIVETRARLAEERFDEDLPAVYEALFGNDALPSEVLGYRFPKALSLVEGLIAKTKSPAYRGYLESWKEEMAAAERALQALIQKAQSQSLAEKAIKNPLNGKTQPILEASREGGLFVQDTAKREIAKIQVPWDRFQTPEQSYELFHGRWEASAAESLDIARLLLIEGLVQESRRVDKTLQGLIENRAPENGDLFDIRVFQRAREFWERAKAQGAIEPTLAAVQGRIAREEEAAGGLNRALLCFAQKDYERASRELRQLRDYYSDTLLFALFSNGSTHLPAR